MTDQFTKSIAQSTLVPGVSRPVLPPLFQLTLVENVGIAFGLFQGFDKTLLAIITVSIAVLIVMGFRIPSSQEKTHWAVGLILGGALGNWIDRLRFGAVVDFLDFWKWPVFNLADTAITIGVGIFLLSLLIRRRAA